MKKQFILFSFLLLVLINLPTIGQKVGDAAPNFTVDLGGGGTFTLSEHHGKVVMIFFFGADCGLCVESGPHVQDIFEDYDNESDFVAVGLDTWPNSSDTKVNGFASSTGISFPLAKDANSVKVDYKHTYDRLVVIDRNGIIRSKNNARAISDVSSVKSAIQTYLDIPTAVNNVSNTERIVSLYPLPATNFVYADLYLENSSEVRFIITDITGKTRKKSFMHLEAGAQHLEIATSDLEKGLYLYQVYVDNKVESGKLLIQ